MARRELTPRQNAIRILFILTNGARRLPVPDADGHVSVFEGEARLHAMDFWVRNPDYLAEELLDRYAQDGRAEYLDVAERIFAEEEPDLRRYAMFRYRFGAYERLDNTLSILASRGLMHQVRHISGGRVVETDFLLRQAAHDLVDDIAQKLPAFKWYADRVALVARVAGTRGGGALKDRQYRQIEYEQTEYGDLIPSITARVMVRLRSFRRAV